MIPTFLLRHRLVDREHGDAQICHLLEAVLPQGRIVAAVVPDLVEDGAFEQVAPRNRPVADLPFQALPRQPIADLRVGREQQHIAVRKLDRQSQAGIIGEAIKL